MLVYKCYRVGQPATVLAKGQQCTGGSKQTQSPVCCLAARVHLWWTNTVNRKKENHGAKNQTVPRLQQERREALCLRRRDAFRQEVDRRGKIESEPSVYNRWDKTTELQLPSWPEGLCRQRNTVIHWWSLAPSLCCRGTRASPPSPRSGGTR